MLPPPPPQGGNGSCPGDELVYNTLPSSMIEGELESGVAVTGTIGCNEYQYYTMNGDAQYYTYYYYYYVSSSYL